LLQNSHSCVIDGYNELVFILRIRIVLTLHDMDSEGCLYPSSRDNLSTDLGCILCISSLANFLHVHSTKHVWCVTAPKNDIWVLTLLLFFPLFLHQFFSFFAHFGMGVGLQKCAFLSHTIVDIIPSVLLLLGGSCASDDC